VIKKCTEVQICDADSTSTDQMHEFPAAPEFNEIQAYKVAEQMMEVLGTAVVTNQVVPEPMETVVLESPAGADKADADLAEGEQADCEPSDLSEEIVVDVCQDSVGDNAEILWSTRAEEGDRVGAAEIGGATANGASQDEAVPADSAAISAEVEETVSCFLIVNMTFFWGSFSVVRPGPGKSPKKGIDS